MAPFSSLSWHRIASAHRRWRLLRIVPQVTLVLVLPSAHPALADFKLCNATTSRLGVSIGYQDQKGWATEGWWNIPAQSCETLLKQMPSRYIYVHAVDYDRAGEWGGNNFMCTADRTFIIRDVKDCPKRGYKRAGFFEIDTGEAKDWTVRLTDPNESGAKPK